jgi:diguanylate cyclase (GGDEF)-like protein
MSPAGGGGQGDEAHRRERCPWAQRDPAARCGCRAGLIQAIAHVFAERLRPNDTLARMGGDEFAAIFHAATPPLIQSLADGLCTAVREQTPTTGTSPIPATISIGAAFFDAGTQTHHEALLGADTAALHEAKAAGGDRAMYQPPQHA